MRKICIITGTRAEWGLFYPLAQQIKDDKDLVLQIIATGMHLSEKYGLTYKEIERDGFKIDKKEEILTEDDTEEGTAKFTALGIIKITEALKEIKPDMVVLLGDRFETFSAAVSAFLLKIPIAHLHGGELTEGAIDDALRHSITKMANFHFVSAEPYRKRVIQLGEEPDRVFNVGALGLDGIKNTKLMEKNILEEKLEFKFGKHNFLVTFHSVTLGTRESSAEEFTNLLKVVDGYPEAKIIFTRPNCDMYSSSINDMIDQYVKKNQEKAVSFASLGREKYFSTLQFVDVVAGNSSSGIIEAPSFGIPTVNVGSRQRGRIKAESVIDADGSFELITAAFKKALTDEFKRHCKSIKNPYGDSNSAGKIVKIIKRTDNLTPRKKFYDINMEMIK